MRGDAEFAHALGGCLADALVGFRELTGPLGQLRGEVMQDGMRWAGRGERFPVVDAQVFQGNLGELAFFGEGDVLLGLGFLEQAAGFGVVEPRVG